MRGKIQIKNHGGRRQKVKIRYVLAAVMVGLGAVLIPHKDVGAEGCPDLKIVFARGSGGERWTDQNYLAFKETIERKLTTVSLDYEFIDLDYPAVGIGVDKLGVTMGALIGAGEAYEFGESINAGVRNLEGMINGAGCPNTRYVIGGYSQGAMVVSKALRSIRADRLIYAATFGDPKIYLPEGEGLIPVACRGENLSDYRMYVPDCRAYKGLLGAYEPYEPDGFAGKVGVWCNNRDIFCSSRHYNFGDMMDHISYVSDNLYEDASRVIFDKITSKFGLENHVSSPHDTAILIDSTGSMGEMIDSYKAEALRLATETLESGGRVALFDYRDLSDPYDLNQHCGFEDCTLEVFENELAGIQTGGGGGDTAESLLSASFNAMKVLNWRRGSTKSLVILTDANFLSPDWDGTTMADVVELSKRIDPVNFYVITNYWHEDDYTELAAATDGKVVINFDELSVLTDYIMERYDSLPRVEEEIVESTELPILEVSGWEWVEDDTGAEGDAAKISFETTGARVMVALNDAILGVVAGDEVTLTGLDRGVDNVVTLVPIGEEVRGEGVEVRLSGGGTGGSGDAGSSVSDTGSTDDASILAPIPKVPDTGKR